jgi:TolB-like protein
MTTSYTFGPFHLDAGTGILFRGADPLALGQRAVALLCALVEQQGKPVSKDALIEAAWPGLTVEEGNLAVQIAALRRALSEEPGGERWIETLPRRGYRFVGPASITGQDPIAAASVLPKVPMTTGAPDLTLPNQPSIAVLPFQNMSRDPEQEYFADGMVEEIITALSRFRSLLVIARNSTFTYKGRSVDVKQVGRELGVRYVLEGSVRKSVNRVRITTQLIDASTGGHLWADRFDGAFEDIFDVQDSVAARVVGEIAPRLSQLELERVKRKPAKNLDAYDCYLRGLASLYQSQFSNREANTEALRLFIRATELDPGFGTPYGWAAICYAARKTNGWVTDAASHIAETEKVAHRAAQFGKDDAVALAASAYALAYVAHDLDAGAVLVDRALALNANLVVACFSGARIKTWLGEPEAAVALLARGMRLSPLDPTMPIMQWAMGHAHFFAGRYGEASSWASLALRSAPDALPALRIIAASDALAGHWERAQKAVARLLQLNPDQRVSNWREVLLGPYRRPEDPERFEDGLRKAGLPE